MPSDNKWVFGLNLSLSAEGEKKLALNKEVLLLSNFLILVEVGEIVSSLSVANLKNLLAIMIDKNVSAETLQTVKVYFDAMYSEICVHLKRI